MRTRIKICGLKDPDAIAAACGAGADAVGFVLVEDTPRYVEPERAAELLFALPPLVTGVGVVRNLTVDGFSELEQRCPCPLMQLHGTEPVNTVRSCGPGVIKSIAFDPATIDAELERWGAVEEVDALLIDAPSPGAGETIDWSKLATALDGVGRDALQPVWLAGGLDPDNVADAIRTVRPDTVDVSSGVERERGTKDAELIERFCAAVRDADRG